MLFVPVATVARTRAWWEVLLRAHAIQNIYYVGACNKVGLDVGGAPDEPYYGTSLIVDPSGDIMVQGSETEEEIVYGDVDLDLLQEARSKLRFYQDRRPELYGAIVRR